MGNPRMFFMNEVYLQLKYGRLEHRLRPSEGTLSMPEQSNDALGRHTLHSLDSPL